MPFELALSGLHLPTVFCSVEDGRDAGLSSRNPEKMPRFLGNPKPCISLYRSIPLCKPLYPPLKGFGGLGLRVWDAFFSRILLRGLHVMSRDHAVQG